MDPLLLIALPLAAFYFLIIRPNQTRRRKQQQVVQSLTPGDRVMTHSGLIGTVAEVRDEIVRVELAPGVVTEWATWGIGGVVPDPAEMDQSPLDSLADAPSEPPPSEDPEPPTGGTDDDRRG
jgi:preprotein translocase subunit YajC